MSFVQCCICDMLLKGLPRSSKDIFGLWEWEAVEGQRHNPSVELQGGWFWVPYILNIRL